MVLSRGVSLYICIPVFFGNGGSFIELCDCVVVVFFLDEVLGYGEGYTRDGVLAVCHHILAGITACFCSSQSLLEIQEG